MKIAIMYKSISGNTKLLAEEIAKEVQKDLVYIGTPKNDIEADLYIVGSWTDKGMCDDELVEFLRSLHNKKIAYFGTAGFGGSTSYFDTLFERIKGNINKSNQILGYYFCQGKMPMSVRDRYVKLLSEQPESVKIQQNLKNFDQALEHPNANDLRNVREWIRGIL